VNLRRSWIAGLALILGCAGPGGPGETPVAELQPAPTPTVPATAQPEISRRPVAAPKPAASPPPAASPDPAEAPALQRLRIVNTQGQGANLRAAAGSQAARLKTVAEGALVDLVGPGEEVGGVTWRQVRDADGTIGWIAAELLAPVTAVQVAGSPEPTIRVPGPTAPAGAATPSTRAVPLDRMTCPESHPIKAVGSGAFPYYAPEHPRYDAIQPDICFISERAAEATGFRPP